MSDDLRTLSLKYKSLLEESEHRQAMIDNIEAEVERLRTVYQQRDALLRAWSGFPGRSCAEAEWNAWMLRMDKSVEGCK